MIRQILYISFSETQTKEDIFDILNQSRSNNQTLGLTGMLLYSDGIYCQLIEGESENIDFIIDRIFKDNRHSNISIVSDQHVNHRLFEDWEMAFKSLEDGQQPDIEGWSDYLENPEATLKIFQTNKNFILSYLESFKQTL